jgi:hypothetical protein
MFSRLELAIMRYCASGLAESRAAGSLACSWLGAYVVQKNGMSHAIFCPRILDGLKSIARVPLDSVTASVRSDTMRYASSREQLAAVMSGSSLSALARPTMRRGGVLSSLRRRPVLYASCTLPLSTMMKRPLQSKGLDLLSNE